MSFCGDFVWRCFEGVLTGGIHNKNNHQLTCGDMIHFEDTQ